MTKEDTACRGCGTCCRKGGPALHLEDMPLLQRGAFLREHLVTLRKGELAFDQVEGGLRPLEDEIVKFAGVRSGVWACRFLREPHGCCGVYADRPVECRALLCRDTRAITALYDKERVSRVDVLRATGAPAGWEELMLAHEEACSHDQTDRLARADTPGVHGAVEAREAFLEAVRLDACYRQLAHERAGVPVAEMEFLFGRATALKAGQYGLLLRRDKAGLVLLPSAAG